MSNQSTDSYGSSSASTRTSVGFAAAIDEIRIEQEEQFIIDNKAALDALLASAEQGE